jgi:hypothetical protein
VEFAPDNIDGNAIRRLIIEGLRIGAMGSVSADRLETTPGREAEEMREFGVLIERTRTRMYVGASRAQRLLAIDIPRSQADRLVAHLRPTGADVSLSSL